MEKDLFVGNLLEVYGQFLNPKQRRLAECYYNEDLSLTEIAENEGVTRQGVCDILNRVKNRLYGFEKSCGYCEKFLKLKEFAAESNLPKEITKIIEEL